MSDEVRTEAIALPSVRRSAFADRIASLSYGRLIVMLSSTIAILGTLYSYMHGYIVAYGDAESHLNIAKRVIDSLTPGLAQLGGIWLPLPHLLLVPFVASDFLWRTGLAGSIVSGLAYVLSSFFIFKFVHLLTKHKTASFLGALTFMINPNVVYMQSTPMTELVLIAFFVMSSYYFVRYLSDRTKLSSLVFAAFFGFCASLSRYDGWALVLMEAGILALYYFPWRLRKSSENGASITRFENTWSVFEGRLIIFSTLAFFGIVLWLLWGFMILGDPLYFTHSEFSAKSQQNAWYLRGELPSYENIGSSLLYYSATALSNAGIVPTILALAGLALFFFGKRPYKIFTVLVLAVPFIFNVATLYLGQSVIFIPSLTPASFEWHIFNVRYGLMMVPGMAVLAGYLYYKLMLWGKRSVVLGAVVAALVLQSALYATARASVITLEDGKYGLSSIIAKQRDAEIWFAAHYDHGMLLADDFSRAISIIHTPIAMHDVIYVGNKPYWDESLKEPEKYARWIIMQQNDPIWKNVWENPTTQARLFKYFQKVYTSDEVLIFQRVNG